MSKNRFLNLLAASILNGVLLAIAPFDYFWIYCIVLAVSTVVFFVVIVMDIFSNTQYWVIAFQILILGYASLGVELFTNYLIKLWRL